MAIPTLSQAFNPITGVFGTGRVQFFSASGTWTVPLGISKVRARVWGGGGYNSASGGGFSMKTIYNLTGVTSVAVTVGAGSTSTNGGTSYFGSYCSATGGGTTAGTVGAGTGGDINYSGGLGNSASSQSGGGVASLFGNGGAAATAAGTTNGSNGASGGGAAVPTANTTNAGGSGFLGTGGVFFNITANTPNILPTSGLSPVFSIDFIILYMK